jgi:hypothetical protein
VRITERLKQEGVNMEIKKLLSSEVLQVKFVESKDLLNKSKVAEKYREFMAKDVDESGDVPGWVLVVLMTTGLVTAIWTIAAPRLSTILKNSLDAMNGIR